MGDCYWYDCDHTEMPLSKACTYCINPESCYKLIEEEVEEHILYRVLDSDSRLLYVGITLNMYQRINNGHKRTADWWREAKSFTIKRYESRAELKAAERRAIIEERPKYNKQHNGGS